MMFYVAGYYLIQGSQKKQWMDSENLLPTQVWSGSRHICEKYPDTWILGWESSRPDTALSELKNAREAIKLSDAEFKIAQKDFNDLHEKSKFGFPNLFMDPDVAIRKYRQYFGLVPDIKLLSLGLPKSYIQDFFNQYESQGFEAITQNGVFQKLKQREVVNQVSVIGYDLLGFDGADFCSFLCGSMEAEIQEKYGVQYNEYGLIKEYDQAERVSKAIAKGEETAEEGFWAPWLVSEIAI